MPKEGFIDRLNIAQQTINNGFQNEEQRIAGEVRREFEEVGVISAFQEVINRRFITTEEGSQFPVHIEYGSMDGGHKELGKGYFLVFYDYYNAWTDREGYSHEQIRKDAIGVTVGEIYPSKKYEIGGYRMTSGRLVWERDTQQSLGYLGQKWHIEKNDVLDVLATAVAIFKYNQEEKKKGASNFLKFP